MSPLSRVILLGKINISCLYQDVVKTSFLLFGYCFACERQSFSAAGVLASKSKVLILF